MTIANLLSLLGGVGLFLYGMSVMSSGIKSAAGDRLRGILERVTASKAAAVGMGVLVTVLVQSSSATDMMVIGFVSSGLMTLEQAVGVIMGANIGTTVTAQITAFDLAAFAPLVVFAGCVMHLFLKKPVQRHVGGILLGLGMLFLGIGLIKGAIAPLSGSPEFVRLLSALSHPAAAILFGALFTALLQSSSSAVVIIQAFAAEGLLTFDQCTWLLIGAAVGAVAPNLLAGLAANRDGKRTALLNLYFNLLRAALLTALLALFPGIREAIRSLSPGDAARQVANAHTLFALTAVLALLPFSGLLARLARRTLPPLPEEERAKEEQKLIYLVNAEKNLPVIALRQGMMELARVGKMARDNLENALRCFFEPTDSLLRQVEATEETVDALYHAVTDKLILLRSLQLSERDVFRLSKMLLVASHYERISDHAENIVQYAARMRETGAVLSPAAMDELRTLGNAVVETLDVSMGIFEGERLALLPRAEALEQRVDDLQAQYMQNHIDRLMTAGCDPVGGVVFTDMCTDLERCSDQALNVATALRGLPGKGVRAAAEQ